MARRGWIVLMVVILAGGLVAGCGSDQGEESGEWTAVSKQALNDEQRRKLDVATEARKRLGGDLLSRVTSVVQEEGHKEAIAVCKLDAPKITKRVAEDENVRIGRTSHRLRNPENTPPEWASHLPEKKPREQEIFKGPNQRIGVTHPIKTYEACTACHGPRDQLSSEVKNQLDQLYPEDEATGFETGDIRGWFWVEVNGR